MAVPLLNVKRNTNNLDWNYGFNSHVTLRSKSHLNTTENWTFRLEIDQNNFFDYINSIFLTDYCNNHVYGNWNINCGTPFCLEDSLRTTNTIYPKFIIYETTHDIPTRFEYSFRPIIVTDYNPVFDARVARSNNPIDDLKINPIIKFLNNFGFDCSTLGREVKPRNNTDNGLMKSEKEWAVYGDCFIGILTKRFDTLTHDGMPPSWIHTEDGLSYSNGRARFAFIEQNVQRDGSYKYLDEKHIIEFDSNNPDKMYDQTYKIMNFREECNNRKLQNHLNNIGTIALVGFGIVGIAVTIDAILSKK